MTKRGYWRVSGKLCHCCLVLVPLAFAQPVEAKATLTVLPAGTAAASINDSGVVVGSETPGLGFLRTPDGTITTFKAVDTAVNTTPQSINNSGVITGYYWQGDEIVHGFVRDADGSITTFDVPHASQMLEEGTFPASVNAKGVIARYYNDDQAGNYHGFVRAVDGTITSIDVAGANGVEASGINDKGEVVGFWVDSVDHGFLRSAKGKLTSFDVPEGAIGTIGRALNNKGVITGVYLDQAHVGHGFIRQRDGTFATFDAGAGTYTDPKAINDKAMVAGITSANTWRYQGFRYQNGKVKAIKAPNANGGTDAYGINKDGVVVGKFVVVAGKHNPPTFYGFILTP